MHCVESVHSVVREIALFQFVHERPYSEAE